MKSRMQYRNALPKSVLAKPVLAKSVLAKPVLTASQVLLGILLFAALPASGQPWNGTSTSSIAWREGKVAIGASYASRLLTIHTGGTLGGGEGIWMSRDNSAGIHALGVLTNLAAGSWGPMTQEGDFMILLRGPSVGDPQSGLVIAPWSNQAGGMRIAENGNVGIGTPNPGSFRLAVNGSTQTTLLEVTGGSDLAERFDITDDVVPEPGTVLSIDSGNPGKLRIASEAYDRAVVGVVSGANGISPGLQLGQADTIADGSVPVAVAGRVYVKAVGANGAIVPGDLLTTSGLPGSVMKATHPSQMIGAIVGKALTPLDDGEGLVLMVVALQ